MTTSMTTLAHAAIGLGLVSLLHAAYSAYEFTNYAQQQQLEGVRMALPVDVVAQTALSTAVICVALVLQAGPLRPILFRAWAGRCEADGSPLYRSPLETRPNFMDIERKRRQVQEYRRRTESRALGS